ncbi:hypothetical protein CJF42_09185 [Pseudoalteromonas sp. NBT06-2]|uniref:hypothetical protein n=1 Tax=Pseudoalteromonas sp. NBT06-2 TaxID=2025950 RepID=UPI000BA59F56|nr:hypothetical protein [Pseudoalteromonas sp. NBT06-2]PAJ74723.1 hypothetical protein CJF42_09185 [Pseudoalteromonas sp. NBT06-2]
MNKYVVASICALAACGNSDVLQSKQQDLKKPVNKVMKAIDMAKSQSDFRLYTALGRKLTIPGFENRNFETIKSQCGLRPMKGTGDVFKSTQEKKERRLKYQFARQYNEIMYLLCLKNS